tara:strand:+ start:63 stop:341 length:279 start_codon:yes stop_codon:yes gene_type:complete
MATPTEWQDLTPSEISDIERLKQETLTAIQEIECKLSPENLSCDGLRSRSEINRLYRAYTEVKDDEIETFKMITRILEGEAREPTFNEIWNA